VQRSSVFWWFGLCPFIFCFK